MAVRVADCSGPLALEEKLLLEFFFAGEMETPIARTRPDASRKRQEIMALSREHLRCEGLGRFRRRRRQVRKLLYRLENVMRQDPRPVGRGWADAPALYRLAYPFAVLFALDAEPEGWPRPPAEELAVPPLLLLPFCARALENRS
ncbi:hypothetical protein [Streptomyces sp. ST2-7A]|uniref:hypothetical protein n=1 Tax=Streptomyces sp. ST2-7A TaxID=2907214 RepID=UPI001F3B3251|nr:hypothetical protein [Streptomyces sp. ST2-7A]MCE7083355.1 hypothetical protein [Streptomyces sp. ST2-7A]